MKNVHIGSIIRTKLEESQLSIAEFAERINRTSARPKTRSRSPTPQ